MEPLKEVTELMQEDKESLHEDLHSLMSHAEMSQAKMSQHERC